MSPIVNELFLRGWKIKISLAFLSQSYFQVPNTLGLSVTHYFIKKIAISTNNIKSFLILSLMIS